MRYYIEAYDADGHQVLGNLDGQAALGECRQPQRKGAWQRVLKGQVRASSRIRSWKLVDAAGTPIAIVTR